MRQPQPARGLEIGENKAEELQVALRYFTSEQELLVFYLVLTSYSTSDVIWMSAQHD